MLNDDERVAGVAELEENLKQLLDIGEMETAGWFIENVDRAARRFLGQFGSKLDPLRLAAGKGGGLLAEMEIAETDRRERLKLVRRCRDVAEEIEPVIDGHGQHIGDIETLVGDLERLAVEPASAAGFAGHIDRREKIHLDLDHAIALAVLAAATLHVKTEPARPVATHAGRGQLREEIADGVKRAGVGERIGAGRATNRRLVDDDGLVDEFESINRIMFSRRFLAVIKMAEERAAEDIVDQGTFAGTADTGDTSHQPGGKTDGNIPQVIFPSAHDADPAILGRMPDLGHADGAFPGEELSGERLGIRHHFGDRARRDNLPATGPGVRTEIDEIIGGANGVFIVLNDDDGVAEIAQFAEGFEQPLVVALMEADARLIENVEDAGEF